MRPAKKIGTERPAIAGDLSCAVLAVAIAVLACGSSSDGSNTGGAGGQAAGGQGAAGSAGMAAGGSAGGGAGGSMADAGVDAAPNDAAAGGAAGRAGTAGTGGTPGAGGTAGTPAAPVLPPGPSWHSHEATLQAGSPQGVIVPQGDAPAAHLSFYEAVDDTTVDVGEPFPTFEPGPHPEPFNAVDHYWTNGLVKPYPYAAKSTMPRGMGMGEVNPPGPLGVLDMQFHPPQLSRLTVAAFTVPADGTYVVTGVAARKVEAMGGNATFKIFGPTKVLVTSIKVNPTRGWYHKSGVYPLGALVTGDRVYFALDRDEEFGYDATELAWVVVRTAP